MNLLVHIITTNRSVLSRIYNRTLPAKLQMNKSTKSIASFSIHFIALIR